MWNKKAEVAEMNKKSEDVTMIKVESNDTINSSNSAIETILMERESGGIRKTLTISTPSIRPVLNPSVNFVQGNNKFTVKRPAVQFLSQDKIALTKSFVSKTTQGLNLLPAPALTLNSSSHNKVQTVSNISNNLTLSPVKGGFKIPISPMKNFKNPVRLSFISTPTSNPSKSITVDAATSVNNRITPQNTSNFQFQTLVTPQQQSRITVNNTQGIPQGIQQQLQSGRYQCVRLVPAAGTQPNTQSTSIPIANLIPTQPSSVPTVRTAIVQQQPIQQFVSVQPSQKPLGPPPAKTQRLIMPATPTQPNPQPPVASLSPGSVLHAGNVGYAMVPAKYVEQLKKQLNDQLMYKTETQIQTASDSNAACPVAKSVVNGKVRKPCNCTKSMCLKLYCECFANGHFCDGCNCVNCHNNVEFDADRSKAIKSCLERNPLAFKPKIGRGGDDNRTHQKGCNCKRSGCLKNYCECYEARIPCTSRCKCIGCKNIEEDGSGNSEQRSLMNLADAAAVRCQQQAAASSRINSQLKDMRTRSKFRSQAASGERLPCMFFTQEVIEATCTCMLAQAEEAEKTNCSIQVAETMILEEFGRCLMQIIQAASKTKPPASST